MNAYTKNTLVFLSIAALVVTATVLFIFNVFPLSPSQGSHRQPAVSGSFMDGLKKTNSSTILRSLEDEFNSLSATSTTATSTIPEADFDQSLSAPL